MKNEKVLAALTGAPLREAKKRGYQEIVDMLLKHLPEGAGDEAAEEKERQEKKLQRQKEKEDAEARAAAVESESSMSLFGDTEDY